jgi:hypothetical protein
MMRRRATLGASREAGPRDGACLSWKSLWKNVLSQAQSVAAPSGIALALLLALAPVSSAQVDTGSIEGTLTDKSGARVAGATVEIENEGTAYQLTLTARSDGTYIFSPVRVGVYTVTVTAAGFDKTSQSHVEVAVQQIAWWISRSRPGP